MKSTWLLSLAAGAAMVLAADRASADPVTEWNEAYLNAIRASSGDSPAGIARRGAMVHGAIYDAINAFEQTRRGYAYTEAAPSGADRRSAIAAAARSVMLDVYGHQPTTVAAVEALYQAQISSVPAGAARESGIALGNTVANAYISSRAADLPLLNSTTYVQGNQPGDWRPSSPNFGGPVGPLHGNITPWTMSSGSQFRPPLPPALGSPAYAAAYNDVMAFGSASSAVRTAAQTEIAYFWACDRDGTYKPPGQLNDMARVVAEQQFTLQGLSGDARESAMARLLATVNFAMADAGIAAWDCKYNTPVDLWRPTEGIRLGDTDGNADTIGDAGWDPLSGVLTNGLTGYVPGFPAYVSGHATFGAAQAAVMRGFFGTDDVTFTLGTDDPLCVGVSRTFQSFTEAARENGRSRVYLGVHWQFDADAGYSTGTSVGDQAYGSLFQVPTPGAATVLGLGLITVGARRRRR